MSPLSSYVLGGAFFISTVSAAFDTQLVGTWSTKSASVLTGPVCLNATMKVECESESLL